MQFPGVLKLDDDETSDLGRRPLGEHHLDLGPLTASSFESLAEKPQRAYFRKHSVQSLRVRRRQGEFFRSRRLDEAGLSAGQPFYKTKFGKASKRKSDLVFWLVVLVGLAGATGMLVQKYFSLSHHEYCLVLEDDFNGSELDTSIWLREQEVGGFGLGTFSMTTLSPNNSFVEGGRLYIVPTLTAENLGVDAITNGYTLNLTASGQCTAQSDQWKNCFAVSDNNGVNKTLIPPVQTARISTRLSRSITYGRVEFKARMPTGDWLWPSIFMASRDNIYGGWPKSGEIDLVMSRGNPAVTLGTATVNTVTTTLHWGADPTLDGSWKTTGNYWSIRNWFNKKDRVFGMQWDQNEIFTYVDTPATPIYVQKFDKPFWDLGAAGQANANGTIVYNPWTGSTVNNTRAAPFDQAFYLTLDLQVGGTTNYWADVTYPTKPWSNSGANPMLDFWNARAKWLASWPADRKARALQIDYVKMWQQCDKKKQ